MLQSRDDIRKDKAVDAFTDAILQRDQPRTAEIFLNLIRDGRSMGDSLSLVTEAEAPFVQVPNHIDVRDGQITLINNDHTILGLRTSADLTSFLPEQYRLLVSLRYQHELSYDEIASLVGLPIGTVKTGLFRAKARLREALSVYEEQIYEYSA